MAMDDGHGKLPMVVQICTTMASKRQCISNSIILYEYLKQYRL